MATQLKAKNTVYSSVRPEFIYLGLEIVVIEIMENRYIEVGDFELSLRVQVAVF
jgi:hypothetical protein